MTRTNTKLYFCNPGEVDIRAIVTLGVNVKDGERPIGHFGTGVKYAIAGVLRLGGSIRIFSGEQEYQFESRQATIRGKDFGLVYVNSPSGSEALGFTTELGKDWEPWMLYRELRSNAIDEGGDCQTEEPHEAPGTTVIEVNCAEITAAHAQRAEFWLEGAPIWEGGGVRIYEGASSYLFYHGIRASNAQNQKTEGWSYSYSFVSPQTLTEDRTFADWYSVRATLAKALLQCENREILETVLTNSPESELDYDWVSQPPSSEFVAVVLERIRQKKSVPESARMTVKRSNEAELKNAESNIPDDWSEMLEKGEERDSNIPEVVANNWVWEHEMKERMKALEAQLKYWRACAMKLAEQRNTVEQCKIIPAKTFLHDGEEMPF